jgi:hypothetical protein
LLPAFSGGLQWLAVKVGYSPSAGKTEDEDAEKGEEAIKASGQILHKHRSQSKAETPGSDNLQVLLVKAFQESVDSERGRNYRNNLPKLRQYIVNKSNASQVFAFAFFWVSVGLCL